MTDEPDWEQITPNDVQELLKSRQTLLLALKNYKKISELVQQASTYCASDKNDQLTSADKNRPDQDYGSIDKDEGEDPIASNSVILPQPANELVYNESSFLRSSQRPELSLDEFAIAFMKFEQACKNVCCRNGDWAKINSNSESYDELGCYSGAKDLFDMIYFASIALTQRLSGHHIWHVTEPMKPLFQGINALNKLELIKKL